MYFAKDLYMCATITQEIIVSLKMKVFMFTYDETVCCV